MNNLTYIGTRNKNIESTASAAILKGLCDDGGLFIPNEIPKLDKSLSYLSTLSYRELAYEIMKLFFTDFSKDELMYCINNAYDEKFDTELIAPVVKKDDVYILELFHGKTLAFKDMALSILPYLMKVSAEKNGVKEEIVILAATSGDTGKAALEGFADVKGTKIITFFPNDGVSPVQKLQMVTQKGENTCVVGIRGNFDDAQSAVKSIFTDMELREEIKKKGFIFSSANSINIGRLIPQVCYYVYAYTRLLSMGEITEGEKINFTVPTGNFGNILAGYFAKRMGLPVNKLICASNSNKVLYDFFNTGIYDKNRDFVITVSPSMDILVSSNLERLLCLYSSQEKTKELMENLNKDGKYELKLTENEIVSEYSTEEETFEGIRNLFSKTGYVMDTHTAVAYSSYEKYKSKTNDDTKNVVVSTASPYKFTKDVLKAIDSKKYDGDPFELMNDLEKLSNVIIPMPIKDIDKREVLHKTVIEKNEIKSFVREFLKK